MNLIEGTVEWHGNGVVVIKERSVMQTVWRFCVQGERQLYSIIQHSVRLTKSLFNQCLSRFRGAAGNASQRNTFKSSSDQMALSSKQAQTVVRESVTAEVKKHQSPSTHSQLNMRPSGALTEIRRYAGTDPATVASGDEQSTLQQLLPALAGFCSDRWLVLVSPAQRPDAAALTAAGIDPSRVLLVHARDSHGFNNSGLNIVEQALQSGTCGAVVAWLEECDTPTLQRLRNAAVTGHAWGVMFREGEKETTQLEMSIR